ncbi:His repressor [Candidatus Syntrophocurvum alkaliphilum]|uniref:His repressor n=1 Tax=Candidatus Syntrophocurvum alkaliphilum TaxID=2293317 RepID=A0A6I6DBG6_9FIRM|nr:YerC/YecD family TrpR-related protein [Candidatus Syntrophocurvum alkaliphilum]QGT98814.1 His repressor [Candidatus Syntrophocurvum alkaliphilum]
MTFVPKWKDSNSKLLAKAILSLENEDEVYRFLDDLCTINEVKALSQRIEVARLLSEDITYNSIASDTGASTATISRVRRCLHHGSDGYKIVLNKITKESKDEK